MSGLSSSSSVNSKINRVNAEEATRQREVKNLQLRKERRSLLTNAARRKVSMKVNKHKIDY